jgi:hypothetical protein
MVKDKYTSRSRAQPGEKASVWLPQSHPRYCSPWYSSSASLLAQILYLVQRLAAPSAPARPSSIHGARSSRTQTQPKIVSTQQQQAAPHPAAPIRRCISTSPNALLPQVLLLTRQLVLRPRSFSPATLAAHRIASPHWRTRACQDWRTMVCPDINLSPTEDPEEQEENNLLYSNNMAS